MCTITCLNAHKYNTTGLPCPGYQDLPYKEVLYLCTKNETIILFFSYRWLPSDAHRMSGFGVPPASRQQRGEGGVHQWGGGGNRLGD